jgi:hypothetical protein
VATWNFPFQHLPAQQSVIWWRLAARIHCGCFSARQICVIPLMMKMISLIRQLTADDLVFKLVMKVDEWVETHGCNQMG